MGARLVRDHIGDCEWTYPDAKAALRPVVSDREHLELLHRKLLEEVGEVIHAVGDDITEELADLLDVLRGLASIHGVPWTEVTAAAALKTRERGGFTTGTVWDI